MKHFSTKLTHILAAILFATFFTACSSDTETTEKATELGMHLNHDKKWLANAETTDGIYRLIEQLEEFSGSANHPVEDFHELGVMLGETMGQLVDQCSMEGEAHDQLHVYIVPIFKYIKTIKTGALADCTTAEKELTEHLKIYDQYFTLEE